MRQHKRQIELGGGLLMSYGNLILPLLVIIILCYVLPFIIPIIYVERWIFKERLGIKMQIGRLPPSRIEIRKCYRPSNGWSF